MQVSDRRHLVIFAQIPEYVDGATNTGQALRRTSDYNPSTLTAVAFGADGGTRDDVLANLIDQMRRTSLRRGGAQTLRRPGSHCRVFEFRPGSLAQGPVDERSHSLKRLDAQCSVRRLLLRRALPEVELGSRNAAGRSGPR